MKTWVFLALVQFSFFGMRCSGPKTDNKSLTGEVFAMEKAFEKMCADSGVAVAFAHFAAPAAVIKRQARSGADSLITGPDAIRNAYSNPFYANAKVKWTPDFVSVSEDGTMAWTHGKYRWAIPQTGGDSVRFEGVFHTVWERQRDGAWKYVWD
jgi:ketosteroid isomerase-like protein